MSPEELIRRMNAQIETGDYDGALSTIDRLRDYVHDSRNPLPQPSRYQWKYLLDNLADCAEGLD